MRKFLLFAFAAFVACTVNAQPKAAKKAVKAPIAKTELIQQTMKSGVRPMNLGKAVNLSARQNLLAAGRTLTANDMKNLKAVNKVAGARKVGELQATYNGYGQNYQTKEAATWKMLSGETEDGTPVLVDVIPLPEAWASMENIAVEYVLTGNTIRIEPQIVATSDDYYFFIMDWATKDYSISITLEDDGSLTTISGEDIAYCAFTSDEFPYDSFASVSNGGTYAGLVLDIENIQYAKEGEVLLPTAGYEPEGLFLHMSPNVKGNYYTNALIPAYGDITLKNRTNNVADAYAWSLQAVQYNGSEYEPLGDPLTATTTDFNFTSAPGAYEPAVLVASIQGNEADPFTWTAGRWYASGSSDEWEQEGTPTCTFTKANPAGGLTYINPAGTSAIILYQGKPASALYFEGVAMQIYDYASNVEEGLPTINCKIYKATRDDSGFALGELVAQSALTEVEEGSWYPRLVWRDFYVEDEGGMTVGLDYVLIDEEFAIVIEGWDNETFSGYPLAFTSPNAKGQSSTFAIISGETDYTGSGWSFTGNVIAGFLGATYGYLHTEDNTELTIAKEGGEATLHIEPMLVSVDEEENYVTQLWLEDEDNVPEWVDIDVANEAYDEENWGFDLVIKADPLPAELEGRTAVLKLAQTGALLKVTVTQGTDGITSTTVSTSKDNGAIYNVIGQRVDASYKGIVVKNGKKTIQK